MSIVASIDSRTGTPSASAGTIEPATVAARVRWLHHQITRIADAVAAQDALVVAVGDLAEVERALRRLESVKLALIGRAEREGAHRHHGASSTSAWLDQVTRSGGAAASRQVALAAALEEELPVTKDALSTGEVSSTSARIIADAMARLPEDVRAEQRSRVETDLVRSAKHLPPGRRRCSRRSSRR